MSVDFLTPLHTKTERDYLGRVNQHPKAECAQIARQFGQDYWDGDRRFGYGGMKYDGRWFPVAQKMAEHYGLKAGNRVLDVGCGKAFLLYELTRAVPGLEVHGVDISPYAVEHSKEEVRPFLQVGQAQKLPYEDNSFDLVFSLTTLHNLYIFDLFAALKEIERVGRDHRYIAVESYRNEVEKANLLYWQLTCECFYTPQEWNWIYQQAGYTGDYSYIYFE